MEHLPWDLHVHSYASNWLLVCVCLALHLLVMDRGFHWLPLIYCGIWFGTTVLHKHEKHEIQHVYQVVYTTSGLLQNQLAVLQDLEKELWTSLPQDRTSTTDSSEKGLHVSDQPCFQMKILRRESSMLRSCWQFSAGSLLMVGLEDLFLFPFLKLWESK